MTDLAAIEHDNGAPAHNQSTLARLFDDAYNFGADVVHKVEDHPVETALIVGGVTAAILLSRGGDSGEATSAGKSFFDKLGGDPLVMVRKTDGGIVQRPLSSLRDDGFFNQDPWWKDLWEQVKDGIRRLTRRL